MNIYIAGRFEDLARLQDVRKKVRALGHEVVGTWLDEEAMPGSNENTVAIVTLSREKAYEYAVRDLTEIASADAFIIDTTGVNVRAGREVEFGYALQEALEIVIVGPRRNVFHEMADHQFETWDDCLGWLENHESEYDA